MFVHYVRYYCTLLSFSLKILVLNKKNDPFKHSVLTAVDFYQAYILTLTFYSFFLKHQIKCITNIC